MACFNLSWMKFWGLSIKKHFSFLVLLVYFEIGDEENQNEKIYFFLLKHTCVTDQRGKQGKKWLRWSFNILESSSKLEQSYILKSQISPRCMKKGFPTLILSLPKWCSLSWVRIFKSGVKAIQKQHSVHITVMNNDKVSPPVIWDSLSFDFRLIISFRWDKLAVLNAWRQNLHPCPEKMLTDTVDKSTWSTLESPVH